MWRHPKYYKELRKRNKSDRVISGAEATAEVERAPGQGPSTSLGCRGGPNLKQQASSVKHQATLDASNKLQAPSGKHQASSRKRQAAQ